MGRSRQGYNTFHVVMSLDVTTKGFPDRPERFFGRQRDLKHLVGRARHKGITAVAGRPQMGKSWFRRP
jgi:hypothetical protein